jgi:hypothetical protein
LADRIAILSSGSRRAAISGPLNETATFYEALHAIVYPKDPVEPQRDLLVHPSSLPIVAKIKSRTGKAKPCGISVVTLVFYSSGSGGTPSRHGFLMAKDF